MGQSRNWNTPTASKTGGATRIAASARPTATPIIESQPLDYSPENITYRTLDDEFGAFLGVILPPYAKN